MGVDLIARYGCNVPRYTSYPTAPHFHAGIGAGEYAAWLEASDPEESLSLYLHIPFCDTLCWFCGCHTRVVTRARPIAAYVDVLTREVALVAERLFGRRRIAELHFGGGSPSLLTAAQIAELVRALDRHFARDGATEVAVEIDPRDRDTEALGAWAAAGMSRASLGVQDFAPEVQAAINRRQSFAVTAAAVDRLRALGVRSLNIDLMYGLPHQTEAGIEATVEQVLRLAPDRVAVFGYAHVPWLKRHQALIDERTLPDGASRVRQRDAAARRLAAAGYLAVGLDHFALPHDSMALALKGGRLGRNFQGYTTDAAATLVGLGASAIGTLPVGYVQNEVSVAAYQRAVLAGRLATARGIRLQAEDRLRRAVIERLMCDLEVDLARLCAAHGRSDAAFAAEEPALGELEADGLVVRSGARLSVTEAGRPYVRSVCAVFDTYLKRGTARHSRAV